MKRIQKLFEQIEAKKAKDSITELHESIITLVRDALFVENVKDVAEDSIVSSFKSELVNKGKVAERFARKLKELLEAKGKLASLSKTDVENTLKEGREFTRFIIEHIQRRRGQELERAKIRVKYGDKYGEVLLLDEFAFITYDLDAKEKEVRKATIQKNGSIGTPQASTVEELEQHLAKAKIPKRAFVKEQIFDSLKEIFGANVEVLVNY
jgi:hypothetical protein